MNVEEIKKVYKEMKEFVANQGGHIGYAEVAAAILTAAVVGKQTKQIPVQPVNFFASSPNEDKDNGYDGGVGGPHGW